MFIDVIVPNFDNDSDEVLISSWYKKVGDKISNGEIIADAETSTIACGITSGYDCFLSKILVKEGETVSQGSKIAIIEINVDKPTVNPVLEEEKEIVKEELENLAIEDDGYVLSVPEEDLKIKEKKLMNETLEEIEETEEKILNNEEKIAEKILETGAKVEDGVIESFSEHAEEKFMNILKDAETKAKSEAEKLKEKILEESKVQATMQGEELKLKILKEYEEKATKDASEMHKKIVQGSISEAENTKSKLIEEAKEKAKKEAEELRNKIKEEATIEANAEADNIRQFSLQEAEKQAKEEAEKVSREIIERAIEESKLEAKEIKKDIIKSATKHAKKESTQLIKDEIKQARRESQLKTDEIIATTIRESKKTANDIKEEILKKTKENIKDIVSSLLNSILVESKLEINHSMRKLKGDMKKPEGLSSHQKEKIRESEKQITKDIIEDEIVKKLLNIKEDDGGTPEMYADNWNKPQFFYSPEDEKANIDFLKKRISEKMKEAYDSSVISTVSNEVDMTAILSLEKTFGKAFSEKYNTRLGFTPFFIMAAIEALKKYKIFNAHIHEDEIIYKNNFDISVITCGNDGISAPVIRQADKLNFAEIERKMITLSRRAIEGTLSIEEVSNGTFTVVNAGVYGSLMGTDILTPPQVATLSVHKMHNRPMATDEGVEIRPMLYVSLSYDHRIADTKLAAEFLNNIKSYVENPGWQILGL